MARYGVSGFPTVKYLNKDGEAIGEMVGYSPVDRFVPEMLSFLGR